MILHSPDTITITQYSIFEKKRDLRLLFRIWVPQFIAIKYAPRFIKQFNELFNNKSEDEDLIMLDKLQYHNKILLMQVLLTAVQLHLGEKLQLDLLKSGKINYGDEKLQYYYNEMELCTGNKIEKIEDINDFRAEIERRIDKYAEMFPEKEVKTTGISFIQLVISVFSVMEMPINMDLTLYQFAELRIAAVEKSKHLQAQIDKYKK